MRKERNKQKEAEIGPFLEEKNSLVPIVHEGQY